MLQRGGIPISIAIFGDIYQELLKPKRVTENTSFGLTPFLFVLRNLSYFYFGNKVVCSCKNCFILRSAKSQYFLSIS